MKILIATTNPGKIKEFRDMLGGALAGQHLDWDDLSSHRGVVPPDETGADFLANACLKATYYARLLSQHVIADDSGLEVDALDGAPGVHSARYAEMNHAGKGDADNNALLLKRLEDIPDDRRTGRFVCVLALADAEGTILFTARDTVEGRIVHAARGTHGFGYDPLFLITDVGKTTAELAPEEKHRISHRGKALRRLRELIDDRGAAAGQVSIRHDARE